MAWSIVAAALAILVLGSLAGAGATASNTWAGVWNTDFGPMTLNAGGSGGYKGYSPGTISGTIKPNRVLQGTWNQPGDPPKKGTFKFVMSSDGRSFTGAWAYSSGGCGSACGWSGTCAQGACLKNGSGRGAPASRSAACRRLAALRSKAFRFNAIAIENGKIVSTTFGKGTFETADGCGVAGTITHRDFSPKTGELDVELTLNATSTKASGARVAQQRSLLYVWQATVVVTSSDDPKCGRGESGELRVVERGADAKHTGSVTLKLCGALHSHFYPNAAVDLG